MLTKTLAQEFSHIHHDGSAGGSGTIPRRAWSAPWALAAPAEQQAHGLGLFRIVLNEELDQDGGVDVDHWSPIIRTGRAIADCGVRRLEADRRPLAHERAAETHRLA